MDTTTITKACLKGLPRGTRYLGTRSASDLPDKVFYPSAMVLNTDCKHKGGTHWICIYFSKDGYANYWDPFGMSVPYETWTKFLYKHSKGGFYFVNHHAWQPSNSSACAAYCIYFLVHRSKSNKDSYNIMHGVTESKVLKFAKYLCKK